MFARNGKTCQGMSTCYTTAKKKAKRKQNLCTLGLNEKVREGSLAFPALTATLV